ncbi:uncharacterized protein PRCAT00000978001 [Priceomyces carsonii]|uniref:uncharacterized protein n=1 Tax=Priceomyces carsonii TaxID=28549 RepID=UPI002ED8EA1C|nr:unnamed protein product [Priceomyces carsonii]
MNEDQQYKRMQVKVLYSFNNNATVFLSRSKSQYSVKVAQIPIEVGDRQGEDVMMLGAFELKSCVQQILKSSPENFKLQTEDYAVYYKDLTEQPDEPFVSNGVMSTLLYSSKPLLIPGRVCQNLSASYLFGDKQDSCSLTLEIRLMLHSIERTQNQSQMLNSTQQSQRITEQTAIPSKKQKYSKATTSVQPVKASRTKSLPIFYNPHNQQIYNIINADKSNAPSKYDSKSVQDRFKLAPFLQAKIIDNPLKRSRQSSEPQRAMRTRSMMTQHPISISSPINEEGMSDNTDATDDPEYRDINVPIDEGDEEEEEEDEDEEDEEAKLAELSPYTPQQPPYRVPDTKNTFQALPDMEDLDGKKTHTIPSSKLKKDHGLLCINNNCATTSSITWRYFETGFHKNHFDILRAQEFDQRHYEGMFGPLCNACYLFLRNKGFMRPEGVVKKYLQQQKYKKELRHKKEDSSGLADHPLIDSNSLKNLMLQKERSSSISSIRRYSQPLSSSPHNSRNDKFLTPSHTPSAINQAIQSNSNRKYNSHVSRGTPNYHDFNDFMSQLNNFEGPLTDIDFISQDHQGVSSPMIATKSNTRVINVTDEGEDKENCPPNNDELPKRNGLSDFEKMMVRSFSNSSAKSSPIGQSEWINNLLGEPTPKDQISPTPKEAKSTQKSGDDTESESGEYNKQSNFPQLRTFVTTRSRSPNDALNEKKTGLANMPSSPLINPHSNSEELESFLDESQRHNISHLVRISDFENTEGLNHVNASPNAKRATRNDTTNLIISWGNSNSTRKANTSSTPNTEFFSNDDIMELHDKTVLDKVKDALKEEQNK